MPGPNAKSGKSVGVNVVARYRPCDVNKHIRVSTTHKFEIMGGKSALLSNKKGKANDHMFHLDMIFNDTTTQQQMFQHVGEPIIRDVLHGYNGTIFAYGQTGSGKTHSLFGDMSTRDSKQRGIIPRSCEAVFDHFQSAEDIEEVTIKCSFIEIYKEKLQDLLMPDPDGNGKRLKIRENVDKTIYVDGVHEEYVSSFDDVFELLQIGFRNRVVASTLMNQQSSRSHCVLTLNIKQTLKGGTIKTSKVNFADLAGSEKVKKTGATGALLEQAKAINQSLSALGNVISALTTKGKKHIPYRDSTLTFLLQDALGGNTKTSLVVTCSSESYNYEETLNTMRFATRAKQMTNKVKVNKQVSVKELQMMIAMYKQKLKKSDAIIARLHSLVKLMRSANYSAEEHGQQIDQYLHELAKVEKADSPKSSKNRGTEKMEENPKGHQVLRLGCLQPKVQVTIESAKDHDEIPNDSPRVITEDSMNRLGVEQKEDVDEMSSDRTSLDSANSGQCQQVNFEMEEQMHKLHASIDVKDKMIEELEEEIRSLKATAFTQNEQTKDLQKALDALKADQSAADGDLQCVDSRESTVESDEKEKKWRDSMIETSQRMEALKLENEAIKQDRAELLLWNQELQKQLDQLLDGNLPLNSEQVDKMKTRISSESVSQQFEHQLGSLRKIVSNSESKQINGHRIRTEQTALIITNLQSKLAMLPELNTAESRDLVDAAVTSIRCLLDSSMNGKNDLENSERFKVSTMSSAEIQEINELKGENEKLIKKLADMKTTWIAHLDMLMTPQQSQEDLLSPSGTSHKMSSHDIGMERKRGKKQNGKSVIVKPIHQKSAIKQSRRRSNGGNHHHGFGLKKMIGYLSGALLQYFGQVAVLRGPLWMCNRKVPLTDFNIADSDYKKVYVVLTKNELLGYRSLLHAESDTKSPLFQHNLKSFVSVLRIEEMLSAMTISSPSEHHGRKSGVFIVSMVDDRVVFRAEGNLSREVWMDNLEALLTD